MEKRYEIDGKVYLQRPLVLGQIRQLMPILEGVAIHPQSDAMQLIGALGDKMPKALAVVLTPEGTSVRDKDLQALAEEIEFGISPEQVFVVVEDFFDCNPIASLLEKLSGAMVKIVAKLPQKIGSSPSSASSPTETLPAGTLFFGDSPPESADPISDTEAGS
ncbi:hypothetical protein [Geobacter sp.]|uniref:hypothetical protein n=1 Tax=Geobacter sp. TaxID=46610 RepID=UPI00261E63AB|nr:hypothetical protein [Geobacter sp.]